MGRDKLDALGHRAFIQLTDEDRLIFISRDFERRGAIGYLAAVIYLRRIVELAPCEALIAAAPVPSRAREGDNIGISTYRAARRIFRRVFRGLWYPHGVGRLLRQAEGCKVLVQALGVAL
ncbi:hypothetical protein [Mesorhizobium sp. M0208]|uniref:hypothetical protein n=1 Tax=Mesorhizobium sp. M0208 TaxID=2956916 RepID=UPI00333AFCA3